MSYYKLADFISLRKGKKQSECLNSDDNAVRYIQIDDLRNDDNLKFTNDEKKVLINEKDVLIAWDGANAGTIGFNLNGSIGSTITAIKINEDFSNKVSAIYLGLFLRSKEKYLRERATGATIPHIQKDSLLELLLPLPSLSTQTQIAKILDKSTALIAKRKAQIAELDTLVQSVFLEMFGDPITNPKKLPKVELSELGIWKSGGTPSRANKAFFTGNIPWITSGELETLYIEDSKEHISEEAVQETAVKEIEIGSILLGMYDTAGLKSSITSEVVTCNQAIAFAKLDDDKVNTIFVYYCIQQQKSHLLKQQRGVRQKNFNLSMIKEINVLYPNLNLQTQFAQIVEKIQTQKSQLQQSLAELEIQHQALMQRAFRGELV
ncbi:restriction endonuclease subunit S [Haemophilus parahaemolyticus]|uniref:restriction endonuclease subunit S n=1 Tax=Haemophilus parahaemolyticus TaxID=735 RepID=UPI0028EA66EA|nr:restriction endonuclease subunit S [Haemophilus parahaemolyticus]